jgi:hypothetical protein
MNVDMSSTMLTLSSFINRFAGSSSANRIKIKYCNLCETVCARADTLTIRKDSPVRHQIIEKVLTWMSTAKVSFLIYDLFVHNLLMRGWQIQPDALNTPGNDLHMACLRAIVKLLDRLPLLAADPTNAGDDTVLVVSRLFNKYSTALLSSLESFHPKDLPVS